MIDTSHNIEGAFSPEAASDEDLLREVLGEQALCIPGETVANLRNASYGELAAVYGDRRAKVFAAARELARRALTTRANRSTPFGNSRDVRRAFCARIGWMREEVTIAVMLDARNRPIAEITVGSSGEAAQCAVSVKSVVKAALRSGAASVILVHNHPSGDPTPSEEDITFTERVTAGLRTVDMRLLDHVIVAEDSVFSFTDAGMLRSK